ncbi:MAG: ABC transporter permease [Ruminococcus sp.]|jgi:ABC-2 type transport system permease protein
MSKLLRANLLRLWKSKVFWGCILILAGYELLTEFTTYRGMVKYNVEITLDQMVLNYLAMAGIALSVFISLFLGTEYHDGTIRNKIIVGNSRTEVYLAGFITSMLGSILTFLLALLPGILAGLPLFGRIQSSPEDFLLAVAGGALLCISYASMFNLAGFLITSKAHGAVVCILASFALLFAAVYLGNSLSQPEMIEQLKMAADGSQIRELVNNPNYVEGTKRIVYQFLMDWLPSGQSFQIGSMEVLYPWRILAYSAVNSGLFGIFGYVLFNRKDMK